jgi:hypothetical protein
VFRRFFDPSTNRWFRVFDRIKTGEPGRFQIFGKKHRIVKLPGVRVLQNPQRIAGCHERTYGYFPVLYTFFAFFFFFAESELGPSRSVHRSRAYMPGLTSSKEPVKNQRTAQHWFKSS